MTYIHLKPEGFTATDRVNQSRRLYDSHTFFSSKYFVRRHSRESRCRLFTFFEVILLDKVFTTVLDSFEKKKFQTNLSLNNIISPNDKLTKILFNLAHDEYYDVIQNGIGVAVTETVSRGKKIQTHFKLNGGGTVTLKRPFNEYDRAVFDVCISAHAFGLVGITRDSIFRILAGGKNNNTRPTAKQVNAIIESVKRLMTTVEIDFSHTRDKIPKYSSIPAQLIAPILPCKILNNVVVNGKLTSLIKFTDESPLMTIARVKKQLITHPVSLRDIPNQNNTPLVIAIKSYVIRRIYEVKLHKQLTPTITFDDIFSHCELQNANRWQKQDVRKIAIDVLENLKNAAIIQHFELTKKENSYYAFSVKFN